MITRLQPARPAGAGARPLRGVCWGSLCETPVVLPSATATRGVDSPRGHGAPQNWRIGALRLATTRLGFGARRGRRKNVAVATPT